MLIAVHVDVTFNKFYDCDNSFLFPKRFMDHLILNGYDKREDRNIKERKVGRKKAWFGFD